MVHEFTATQGFTMKFIAVVILITSFSIFGTAAFADDSSTALSCADINPYDIKYSIEISADQKSAQAFQISAEGSTLLANMECLPVPPSPRGEDNLGEAIPLFQCQDGQNVNGYNILVMSGGHAGGVYAHLFQGPARLVAATKCTSI